MDRSLHKTNILPKSNPRDRVRGVSVQGARTHNDEARGLVLPERGFHLGSTSYSTYHFQYKVTGCNSKINLDIVLSYLNIQDIIDTICIYSFRYNIKVVVTRM